MASALRTAPLVFLTGLPPDYLRIASGLGTATPERISASPLLSQDTLLGVVEVATFRSFDSRQHALIGELLPLVAMSLEILQRNLRTQELLGRTQAQARQLEEQTGRLTESKEELLAQQEQLLTQQSELTTQQQQLQETEQFFRSVLELAPDGLMVVDENGVIRLANAQCEKLFGYPRDELIGQRGRDPRAAETPSATCRRCARASIRPDRPGDGREPRTAWPAQGRLAVSTRDRPESAAGARSEGIAGRRCRSATSPSAGTGESLEARQGEGGGGHPGEDDVPGDDEP